MRHSAVEEQDQAQVVARKAVVALMMAADVARREMVEALDSWDITLQQFNVLLILARAGDAGLPTLVVAQQMIEQAPGITRLMNRLVAKKYIRRTANREDRRQQLCRLTPEGARLLERAAPPIRASFLRIVQDLNSSERVQMVEMLERIANRKA